MPKIQYREFRFSRSVRAMIDAANSIISEYDEDGYELTLRQLYYQFVSRNLIANKQSEYKRLGSVVNDGRLAGLIDWTKIVDMTRNLEARPHWEHPADYIMPQSFNYDLWADQPNHVEVWIEKDALVGVITRPCKENDVAYFSCRGYTSQSELWAAAMRMVEKSEAGKVCHVIHLGDHDPSGKDMTRDITDRLEMFCENHDAAPPTVHRIALNMDQIKKYDPPPNPCKITDSRAAGYIREFGHESWELDALSPKVLDKLIRDKINSLRNAKLWNAAVKRQQEARDSLEKVEQRLRGAA